MGPNTGCLKVHQKLWGDAHQAALNQHHGKVSIFAHRPDWAALAPKVMHCCTGRMVPNSAAALPDTS